MRKRPARPTPKRFDDFLGALRDGHTVSHAAKRAGFSRDSAYAWREEFEDFRTDWDAAIDQGTETLEQEARRRAVDGVEVPIYDKKGEQIGTTLKHSDVLLIFLLKGRLPQKYRDNVKIESETKHSGGVLVIGGDEAAYVAALKQIKNGHKEEAIKNGG